MINPSEISQVLKQQLENVNSKVSFEETGVVLEVGDGVEHGYGHFSYKHLTLPTIIRV